MIDNQIGSLGFEGVPRATLWLEDNVPGGPFGLTVDPHMVMDHMQQANIFG
jgi:hypothetical protein